MLVFFNIQLSAQQGNFLYECQVEVDSFETMSQSVCHTNDCSYGYDDFMDIYMVNENTPIKTIRIKYYIVHYSETEPRNFELSNTDHLAFLEATVAFNENIINNMYIETDQMCQEHNCHIDGFTHNVTDAKIRFEVDYVEVVHADLWNADTESSYTSYRTKLINHFLTGENTHIAYFITGSQCLYEKVVLQNNETCDGPWANNSYSQWIQFAQFPDYINLERHSGMGAPAVFAKYVGQNNGYFCDEHPNDCCPACPESWQMGSGLVHEIGHVLGLRHTKTIPSTNPAQFYCVKNVMHPAAYRRYLNDVQIAQLHRGISQTNVRNAVVNCESSANNLEIDRDHTWHYSKKMYQNILVKAPNTLTIKCELQMINNGKIFVEPGARLVVDGGVITKGCDELWGGIEVWGNSNLNQWGASNQGKVELKNGAVIEYAKDAISLIKTGYINTTGGIVNSNNATFRNNKRSVQFMKYDFNSHSSFINTTFTVDDDFIDGQDFNAHVTLWDVRGVRFSGCRFLNEMSNALFDESHNKGIYSIDAGYFIQALCDAPGVYTPPCSLQYLIRSEFKGLSYGVQATTSSSSKTVIIDQTDFENNYFGAVFDRKNSFNVVRSEFLVGGSNLIDPITIPRYQKGIHSIENTRFTIEDNYLAGAQIDNPSVGIRIDEAQEVYSRTYNNYLEHLYIGHKLEGYNRSDRPHLGFQTICNRHHNNTEGNHEHDVLIVVGQDDQTDGILQYQGSKNPELSSGTTFSHTSTNAYSDVLNNTEFLVTFYHTGGITKPEYYNYLAVDVQEVANAHSCPSNFSGKYSEHHVMSISERNAWLDLYDDVELDYVDLLYNYELLIDGGSTSDLVDRIQSTWPQEAWDLYDDLIEQSPFLSEQVLIETADQDVLPVALYFEVCLANPDASKNSNFLHYIEFEAPSPLPGHMIEIIRENRDSITLRSLMEMAMIDKSAELSSIANLMLTEYQLDTIRDLNKILYWISRPNNLHDRYALIESFIEDGDFSNAYNFYNGIANDFNLRDNLLTAYNEVEDYIQYREQIFLDNRTIAELDSVEIDDLEFFAATHIGHTQRFAANILCFFYENCQFVPLINPQHSPRPQGNQYIDETAEFTISPLEVYPNPAESFTTFSWDLDKGLEKATLTILNASGQLIKIHSIYQAQGQYVLDTRPLPSGIYLYQLTSGSNHLATGRLTIQK